MTDYLTAANAITAAIVAMGGLRLAYISYYFTLFPFTRKGIIQAARESTVNLAQREESPEVKEKAHSVYAAVSKRQFDASVLMGTIAAATWSVLFVERENEPTADLSGVSLGLLFAGALTLISGPVLARMEGRHLSLLLRDAALYIGSNAILFSFCSMITDLVSNGWRVVALAVVAIAAVRDAADSYANWKEIKDLKSSGGESNK
ncbi:hypothetical protein [Streptomyces nondiastaticus]|uniref:Integral membrane protein n=1 Tax=Streptomyces nondiastaticus TaxID=3154512 RepID=A0ABW6TVP6_9ACTN